MSRADTALTMALCHIAEALGARAHPEHDLLQRIEALPLHMPLARAVIIAAGEHCEMWLADAPQRKHQAALDYSREMRAA